MGQECFRRETGMKMKIVHVLCEGQTEQGFVNNVLKPYLIAKGIVAVKSRYSGG